MALLVVAVPPIAEDSPLVRGLEAALNANDVVPAEESWRVHVSAEGVTVFLQHEKRLLSSQWRNLGPDERDPRRYYRYAYDAQIRNQDPAEPVVAAIVQFLRLR